MVVGLGVGGNYGSILHNSMFWGVFLGLQPSCAAARRRQRWIPFHPGYPQHTRVCESSPNVNPLKAALTSSLKLQRVFCCGSKIYNMYKYLSFNNTVQCWLGWVGLVHCEMVPFLHWSGAFLTVKFNSCWTSIFEKVKFNVCWSWLFLPLNLTF